MKTTKLNSINPTGGIFVEYKPEDRLGELTGTLTTYDIIKGIKADEKIKIYRGAGNEEKKINSGDFITTNEKLAKDYNPYNVLSMYVMACEIITDAEEPENEEFLLR
jgi:hypothetical protein